MAWELYFLYSTMHAACTALRTANLRQVACSQPSKQLLLSTLRQDVALAHPHERIIPLRVLRCGNSDTWHGSDYVVLLDLLSDRIFELLHVTASRLLHQFTNSCLTDL